MDEVAQVLMEQIAAGKLLGFAVSEPAADAPLKPGKLAVSKLGAAKQGVSPRG